MATTPISTKTTDATGDPRTYFKFKSCARCFYKPCNRLRFGGVHPGKFMFVHGSIMGQGFVDCGFLVRDAVEIELLASAVAPNELAERLNDVLGELTPVEANQFRQEDYISHFSDFSGMIKFIDTLRENHVINILRVPFFLKDNAFMRKWLYSYEGLIYALKKPELEKEDNAKAVTDALAADQKQLELNNPRWEHIDKEKADSSPDKAAVGDSISLMVSAPGFPDGAPLTFDIYDSSSDSPVKIDSASGSVDGGRGQAKWTVKTGENSTATELDWEASGKGKKSEKGKIKLLEEVIGAIAVKISSIFGNPLNALSCELFCESKSLGTQTTDDQGIVTWNDLPLKSYTLSIKNEGKSVEMPIAWMSNTERPFLIKL